VPVRQLPPSPEAEWPEHLVPIGQEPKCPNRDSSRVWKWRHPAKVLAYRRRWYAKNAENETAKALERYHKRMALRRSADVRESPTANRPIEG
jgi:hypothetical protein